MQFLNLDCYAVGGDLFLLNEDGTLSQQRITQIGGISINKIFEIVQTYFAAENDTAKDLNNNIWTLNREVLKLAGCHISNSSVDVDITINKNGVISEKKIEFIKRDINQSYNYSTEIESKMINDILYIDMNICNVNKILENQIVKLKEAVENGTNKIIIDVRDNPGGNSLACEKLLDAIDMGIPNYGVYVRYSELAHKQRRVPIKGFEQYEPDKSTAKRNENIELVVLTNEKTFSSATMMGTYVKDGNLGTVIGVPSSNSPSSYGDILSYKMPNSKIDVSISYKRFLRPDTETDQRILQPDIITQYNTDILQVAIDYLSTK